MQFNSRTANVLTRLLVDISLDSNKFSADGYSELQPIADNTKE